MTSQDQINRRRFLGQPDHVRPQDAKAYDEGVLARTDEILRSVQHAYAAADKPTQRLLLDLCQLLGASTRKASEQPAFYQPGGCP